MLAGLAPLTLGADDELIVVDNTPAGTITENDAPAHVKIVHAPESASSYYARNFGADVARGDWLLFLDADCRPSPALIDDYFEEPIPDDVACVAGAVLPLPGPDTLTARYTRYREPDKQWVHMAHAARRLLVTANALVCREVWQAVGGFCEGIRSGGDVDFSWRVQDAGWKIAYNQHAVALHLQRETLRALLRQHARYGAGRRWLSARHGTPGLAPSPQRIVRPIAGTVRWTLAGQPERALFRGVDAAVELAMAAGYLTSNAPRSRPAPASADVVIAVDSFPEPVDPSVAAEARALREAGRRVSVEAVRRGARLDWRSAREIEVRYMEDDSTLRRLGDLAWLVLRHPLRCVGDLARRARRRDEEAVPLRALAPAARRLSRSGATLLYVCSPGAAALVAPRLSRLTGVVCKAPDSAGAGRST